MRMLATSSGVGSENEDVPKKGHFRNVWSFEPEYAATLYDTESSVKQGVLIRNVTYK